MKIIGVFNVEVTALEAKRLRELISRTSGHSYDCKKLRPDDVCECEACIQRALLEGLPC